MDDSDDYFDDFVLDEGTIAALDEVESQFATTQHINVAFSHAPPRPATRRPEPPPAKRQKIERTSLKRELSANDYDDLPEISVQGDNYYQVNAAHPAPKNGVVYRPSDTQAYVASSIPARSSSGASNGRNTAPQPSQQLARRATGPVLNAIHPQPGTTRGLQRFHSSNQVFGSQAAPRGTQSSDFDRKAKRDAEIFRVKLEELERNRNELQQKLQAAEDARFAKEGEVSILRASITRTTEQHAAEVARLQAAREAAEAAKLQLQKEQREELERLKTHYTFRQHELETSTRKPPWSVTKKQVHLDPNTPVKVRMSSQMRGWNTGGGFDVDFTETPRGPRFGAIEKQPSQRPRQLSKTTEGNKKNPMLPGFHNSFIDSPSRHLSQKIVEKGKNKQRASLTSDNPFFAEHTHSSPPSSPLGATYEEPHDDAMELVPQVGQSNLSPTLSKSPPQVPASGVARDEDVKMTEGTDDLELQDDLSDIDPPNWRDELHHVLFTHTLLPGKPPTMQILLNSSLQPTTPPEQLHLYTAACSRLLEKLGITPRPIIWEHHLREIANVFADLARILNDNATIYPLSSLLGLLRILSYTIPSFTAALLSSTSNDMPPPILVTLCDVVRLHLAANAPGDDFELLAKEGLFFLESLALTAPEELIPQLSVVVRGQRVLSTLLGASQPTWLVAHTTRALCLLASHGTLSRSLVSFPVTVVGQDDLATKETGRLPHIEQLSFYLIDASREGPEADQLRDHILTFVSILALSHPDALSVLLQSQTLIPSIVLFLTNETISFWEDDEHVISSAPKLDRVLRISSRTIALLYYMVFTSPEPYSLSRKLHHTPHRQFNGIGHMFGVTMGRFSFADSPCWLNDADRVRFEQTVDMAKDLLEQVMEGPEMEDVWMAFQPDNEPSAADDDDEEREARLLHPDNDN
ncbi:hypothetical protein BC835DRAFT_1325264 [Cytidiella melzeri]|nr:hypothetical protein BC835DRAFT_1325264 [Cytidiella melzeri]